MFDRHRPAQKTCCNSSSVSANTLFFSVQHRPVQNDYELKMDGFRSACRALLRLLVCAIMGLLPTAALAQGPGAAANATNAGGGNANNPPAPAQPVPTQTAATPAPTDPEILARETTAVAAEIAGRAATALGQYLPAKLFRIDVQTQLAEASRSTLPYMPGKPTSKNYDKMSLIRLLQLTARNQVELSLAQSIDQEAVDSMTQLVRKILRLDDNRGDSIEVVRFVSYVEQKDDPAFQEANQQILTLQQEVQTIRQERDRLQADLQAARNDLQGAQARSTQLDGQIADLGRQLSEAQAEQATLQGRLESLGFEERRQEMDALRESENQRRAAAEQARLLWIYVLIGLGSILLIVGVVAFLFVSRAVRAAGTSIGGIGDAIESAASRAQTATPAGGGGDSNVQEVKQVGSRSSGENAVVSEGARARLLELNTELNEAMEAASETAVLETLARWLNVAREVPKSVAFMELLGREKANSLFHQLSTQHQQTVMNFLSDPVYPIPKWELMLEVGEEMKSALLAPWLSSEEAGERDQELVNDLIRLSDGEVAGIAGKMQGEDLGSLWRHLDSKRITEVMRLMYQGDQDEADQAMRSLGQAPNLKANPVGPKGLKTAITAQLQTTKNDPLQRWIPLIQRVVESLDGRRVDHALNVLSEVNQPLGERLSARVVSVATFFRLGESARRDCLNQLNNQELAGLVLSDERFKQASETLLNTRRRELLEEELEIIGGREEQERLSAQQVGQQRLVSFMRDQIREGRMQPATDGDQVQTAGGAAA